MIVSDVLDRASELLFDTARTRWTLPELCKWLTDGLRTVVQLRPDAGAKRVALQLVGGTRQTLPADAVRLLRITRNLSHPAGVPGRSVIETTHEALNAEVALWHSKGSKLLVEKFAYDQREPKHFDVYPAMPGADGTPVLAALEVIYAANPPVVTALLTDMATLSQTLTLSDEYLSPLVDWVLWRALSKDSEAANLERAVAHRDTFAMALQISQSKAAEAGAA